MKMQVITLGNEKTEIKKIQEMAENVYDGLKPVSIKFNKIKKGKLYVDVWSSKIQSTCGVIIVEAENIREIATQL